MSKCVLIGMPLQNMMTFAHNDFLATDFEVTPALRAQMGITYKYKKLKPGVVPSVFVRSGKILGLAAVCSFLKAKLSAAATTYFSQHSFSSCKFFREF